MKGTQRSHIQKGLEVHIMLERDQRTGHLTHGIVKDVLTKSASHPHGIKVRLEDSQVGRIKKVFL